MKTIRTAIALSTIGVAVYGQSTIVDTLNGTSLSPYTLTPVLYSGTSPDTTAISFSDSSGGLQATASTYNNIEQALFLRSDYSLTVGETLEVTIPSWVGSSQDFGLCVASTATPPAVSTTYSGGSTSTRNDLSYGYIGLRAGGNHLVASGFDGSTGITTVQNQPGGTQVPTTLFITETALNSFTFGAIASNISTNGGMIDLMNYTFVNNSGVGNAIGFYVDMRSANTIGSMDNLTITVIPEPSTLALCGVGLAGMFTCLRRKK
jgi:hypothetical protein